MDYSCLINNKKIIHRSGWLVFLLTVLLGVPFYVCIVLPILALSLAFVKLTGLVPKHPKPLLGIMLEDEVKKLVTPWKERKYDLVLFGATGFTGRLAAHYIAKTYGTRLRWAIAGRNLESLKTLRESLTEIESSLRDLDLLVCDSSKPSTLKSVVSNTRVIASTVGPFTLYGSPVVSLCAQMGTSYCDIDGEIPWVRQMIISYQQIAASTGARIIHMAGHDCLPWELTVLHIARLLQEKGESLVDIQLFDQARSGPSGGTLETVTLLINNPPRQPTRQPFDPLLTSVDGTTPSPNRVTVKNVRIPQYSHEIGRWVGPFVMADANSTCIKRSNAVLNLSKNFTYREAVVYPDFKTAFTEFFNLVFGISCLMAVPLQVLLKKLVLPKPGSGPSKEQMDKGFLVVEGVGRGSNGTIVKSLLYFPNDPGYRDTARMLVETGLALAFDNDTISIGGGVWTPACIGEVLLPRLIKTGCEWKIGVVS